MRFGFAPWWRQRGPGAWQPGAAGDRIRRHRRTVAERLRLRVEMLTPVIAYLDRAIAEAERVPAASRWRASPRVRRLRAARERLRMRKQMLAALAAQLESDAMADSAAPGATGPAERARQSAADYDV